MKNFQSRISKIENELQKVEKQRSMNIREMFKKIDPDLASKVRKEFDIFIKKYGYKFSQHNFTNVAEDAPLEDQNRILFTNFTQIVVALILSMYRASYGSADDKAFLQKIEKDKRLSITYQVAKDAVTKHAEMNDSLSA